MLRLHLSASPRPHFLLSWVALELSQALWESGEGDADLGIPLVWD